SRVSGDKDVLELREALERIRPELAPDSRPLETSKGGPVTDRGVRVDRDRPGLDGTSDPEGAPDIPSPDRAREPVDAVVGDSDGVRLFLKGYDRDYRAEDLLTGDRRFGRHRREHGRGEPVPGAVGNTAPEGDRGTLAHEGRDVGALLGAYQRAHLALLVGRVDDLHGLYRLLEVVHETLVGAVLHQYARAGAAVLSRVVEDRIGRSRGRGFDVGVGEDDVGALSPELEGHPLYLLGAPGHDLLADLGRAGEADLADGGMGHKAPADHRAPAGQDLENALGDAGLQGQLAQADRRQRCQVRRLQHDRIARSERRPEAPRGDRHGEVPGHDDPDDPDRLAESDVHAAGHRYLAPEEP